MKANELMIGDWVKVLPICHKVEPHYDRIESIRKEYTGQIYIEGGYHDREHNGVEDWYDWSVGLRDIEPISLTTEILEKNGFQKQEEERGFSEPYTIYVNDDYKLPIKIYPKGIMDRYHHLYIGDYDDDPFISLYINNVHELQHALRLVGLNELADNIKVE